MRGSGKDKQASEYLQDSGAANLADDEEYLDSAEVKTDAKDDIILVILFTRLYLPPRVDRMLDPSDASPMQSCYCASNASEKCKCGRCFEK